MGIVFHCTYCGKQIEAKDGTGGKYGTCPSCHNKVYIPDLSGGEEIKLAPIDETEEQRKKRLMLETLQLDQEILAQKEGTATEPALSKDVLIAHTPAKPISVQDLRKTITGYLRHMADGELDEAANLSTTITSHRGAALKILDSMAMSEMPEPGIEDIPVQVLRSLIKQLRIRIVAKG